MPSEVLALRRTDGLARRVRVREQRAERRRGGDAAAEAVLVHHRLRRRRLHLGGHVPGAVAKARARLLFFPRSRRSAALLQEAAPRKGCNFRTPR